MRQRHPIIRLYFNKGGALPWSVDTGIGTKEYNAVWVEIQAYGRTVYASDAGDNVKTPTAWLQFKNCFLTVGREVIIIGERIMEKAA